MRSASGTYRFQCVNDVRRARSRGVISGCTNADTDGATATTHRSSPEWVRPTGPVGLTGTSAGRWRAPGAAGQGRSEGACLWHVTERGRRPVVIRGRHNRWNVSVGPTSVGSSRWPAVKAGIVRPPAPVSCPTAPVSCPTAPVSCPTAPAPHPTAPAPHPTAPAPHPTGPVWCPTGPAPYPTAPASHRTARAPIRFPAPPVGCSPGSCLARLSFRANRGSLPAGCRPSQGWPSFCPVLRSERRRDRAAPPGPIAAAN